jgi:hypothetical protein
VSVKRLCLHTRLDGFDLMVRQVRCHLSAQTFGVIFGFLGAGRMAEDMRYQFQGAFVGAGLRLERGHADQRL